ncbi:hypothetical protein HYZ99_04130 [Candidatus Peregrinibacteria bacterium]|nr:hypothetical protein [Candidatus Peregrinibacteria bacterium]
MKSPGLTIGSLVLSVGAVTLLAGCSGTQARYRLEFDTEDATVRTQLVDAAKRVVQRRLEAIGEDPDNLAVTIENGETILVVDTASDAIKDSITEQLTAPFTMRIMKEVEGTGDITVEGHGSFAAAGITEEHLEWVTAGKDTDPEKGRVMLEFTEEGRAVMGEIFHENVGKYIGLFVRDRLVSKLLVESDEVKENIIITDIPAFLLAEIFADDLNVGLHVTFVPAGA